MSTVDFTVALRGYDRAEVDRVLGAADAALASGGETARAAAGAALRAARFPERLRGYARAEVDRAVADRLRRLGGAPPPPPPPAAAGPGFTIVLRGYDMTEVDRALAAADAALAAGDTSARAALREVRFRERLRGYARAEVDGAIADRLHRLG